MASDRKGQKRVLKLKMKHKDSFDYQEAISTLRTNIRYCGRNRKVILFTSTLPNEGKSSISFSYALAQARLGSRTLYIDSDIRNSVATLRYGISEQINGLSQYLTGQYGLDEVIYSTTITGLDVLFSGPFSPNPVELLEDEYFDYLIDYARNEYDCIVIDTAPVGTVIDAAIVARRCDGVVFVVESGAVSYRLLQRARDQIQLSGCRILGVVLNKVEGTTDRYYSHYGKYGHQGGYGKYGESMAGDSSENGRDEFERQATTVNDNASTND